MRSFTVYLEGVCFYFFLGVCTCDPYLLIVYAGSPQTHLFDVIPASDGSV